MTRRKTVDKGSLTSSKSPTGERITAPGIMPGSSYLACFISLVVLVVYLPTLSNDFVNWDDYIYVVDNVRIRSLNPAFFSWAFTDLSAGFWHPLTWVSLAVDYAFWGLNPLGFHLSAILLHAANTFLVTALALRFFDLQQGSTAPSWLRSAAENHGILIAAGLTGLLFGLHPLHVESVAWVSERKDLLCALFFLLSIRSYLDYVNVQRDQGGSRLFWLNSRYLLSLILFVCALASKTMAVSLPLVLLILDWYPLGRIRSLNDATVRVMEKIPFLAASLGIAVVSIVAQKSLGALSMMATTPLWSRVLVAFRAQAAYLVMMIFPTHLIPIYPYPRVISLLSVEYATAIVVFLAITAGCIRSAGKQSVWLAAWSYYVITLFPTLGIVQVGVHSMADRFTYLPSIGLFLLIGLGAAWLWGWAKSRKAAQRIIAVSALVLVFALSFLTLHQISVWRTSADLWNHVIGSGTYNPMAYNSRGHMYKDRGDYDRAIADYGVAIAQEPAQAEYLVNRGVAYAEKGDFQRALIDLDQAITLNPKEYMAYNNRANVWYLRGDYDRAIEEFTRAIVLKPLEPLAIQNRGAVFEKKGEMDRAVSDFREADRLVGRGR